MIDPTSTGGGCPDRSGDPPSAIEAWPDRLEAACRGLRFLSRPVVVRETGSTQDLARGRAPGDVVVAWRQTHGRGRDGRTWEDTGLDGMAMTAVVDVSGPWIALAAGAAAADAIERVAPRLVVGLKWPNDLMIAGRKVGGVLIERHGDASLIGIGINVTQRWFGAALAARAASLATSGASIDRLELLEALLPALEMHLAEGPDAAIAAFGRRDMLRGRRVRLSVPGGEVEGIVRGLDPLRCLWLEVDGTMREFDVATARIESFE